MPHSGTCRCADCSALDDAADLAIDRDEWRQVSRDWRVRAESAEAEVSRLREQVARARVMLQDRLVRTTATRAFVARVLAALDGK